MHCFRVVVCLIAMALGCRACHWLACRLPLAEVVVSSFSAEPTPTPSPSATLTVQCNQRDNWTVINSLASNADWGV